MKKIYNPIFIQILITIILIFVTVGCDEDFHFIKKVRIKGKINKTKSSSSIKTKSTDNPYTLDDAEKVLIFYGRDYDLARIQNDGSFSGSAELGSATALAFLTENNEFIGNLFVGGMNFIPLQADNGDLSEIDLSDLILDGDRVIPSNDPINTQITLSDAEIQFMQEIGSYYKSLSKNIDMDNDGNPDMLQHGKIDITINSNFYAGKFGLDDVDAVFTNFDQSSINYSIFMEGPIDWVSSSDNSIPENATISGPAENPISDLRNAGNSYSNNSNFKVNFARGDNDGTFLPFPAGVYTLNIDNKEFTFYYSNLNTFNYWILAIPSLITNDQDQVTGIRLKYQFPDGTPVDPRKLLSSGIDVSINGSNYTNLADIRSESNSITDLSYDFYHIILDDPINLSDINSVNIMYFDLFGNNCGNGWDSDLNPSNN